MLENTNDDLVRNIVGAAAPKEFSTRLKFIALDKTIFEIELSTNTPGQLNDQMRELVKASVEAATSTILSAK
ncbi:hypothetical protein [Acinetobacter sp. CFCC 10889]|uniref:hypothetical protein n=1 Tax=Acinetobacter sp. CFCC 10889 TaxID=1775557 RepID=UPI000DCF9FC3|nr:hypothetical protein [Acinetobacter sp. CFCC 10889]